FFEQADCTIAARLAQQASDRFEHRQIRLRDAVVLEARPARDHDVRFARCSRHEGVEHRRLSDPGLTGEEYELALTGAGALEPRLEVAHHIVTSDELAVLFSHGWPPRRARSRGDESIPAARDGLDEARLLGIIIQRTANLEDDHPENAVGHMGV